MSPLDKIKREDRRCAILRILAADTQESASVSMIDRALDALGPALRADRDQVEADVHWLKDQGLVTLEEVGGFSVATLTQAGHDVALGDRLVPGVSRKPRER